MLDGTSPFTDYSGYGTSAVLTGSLVKGVGLVQNAGYSVILDNTHTLVTTTNIYTSGNENAFTIMASIFPVQRTTTADQQIASHLGKFDGLSINGTVVSFSTKYLTAGEAKCSFDIAFYRRVDLMGVHTRNKNSLYVNGVLVDEVDISAAQQADAYDSADGKIYSGTTSSTQGFMMNALGFLGRALAVEEVRAVTTWLNRRFTGSPVRAYGGQELKVSTEVRPLFLDAPIDTDDAWNSGVLRNVSVNGTSLVPDKIASLTVGGQWSKSFDLYTAGTPTPLQGVNLMWTGKNVTVEASVNDGTTWITASPGVNLSNIPTGFDPTNKALAVRVTFAQGVTDAYIDNFRLNGYNTSIFIPQSGRTLTFASAVNFPERNPLELREDWGARLFSGTLSWSADNNEEPYNARTIEVWLRKNSTAAPTLSFTPTTTYVNSISGGTSARGEWALYHYVLGANATTFNIGGNVTVGRVGIYDTALSAATISGIYKHYTGVLTQPISDGAVVAISEPATSTSIYAHDWSIQSA